MQITEYLKPLAAKGVSDIHFKVGVPPLCRINGSLEQMEGDDLGPKDTERLAGQILGNESAVMKSRSMDIDTSFSVPGLARFRASIFKQRGTVSIVMRMIPFDVPTIESLGLPDKVKDLSLLERGLILITGAAGTGKSSTLASMVNHINENTRKHVITIEDPIEFLHKDKYASINQREVGIDTSSFESALRAALRQDPDIILVGEIRDAVTTGIALKAAETGHLVLSTLHTTDAKETLDRLIDTFQPHQQTQIRIQLSSNLKAVISQRLLERADGNGLVLAPEIMVVNAAIQGHILKPMQTDMIIQNMVKGKEQYGMQTFDQAIYELAMNGTVSVEEALRFATSPNDLRLRLSLT